MTTIIKIRRDTAANWTSTNPTLALGEPGYETDTHKMKVGDGTTAWNSLAYNAVGNATYATTAGSATTATTAITATTATTATTANTANTANTAASATVAETVTSAAQPNITSLGTLISVTSTGIVNLTGASNVDLGPVGNIHITGGTNGQVLTTDGSGTLSWATTTSSYGNSEVASYLPTYTGNLAGTNANIGNMYISNLTATGEVIANKGTNSINPTTGTVVVTGGVGVSGNIHANLEVHSRGNMVCEGQTLYVGPYAIATGITEPVLVAFHAGSSYIQTVIKNSLGTGSADYTAFADNGSDIEGWISTGFASSEFNDPTYTITGPGDGYVFTQGLSSTGGNLVFATGGTGIKADIIFATGGFETTNEFGRISHANAALELTKANSKIKFSDATEQNTAWTGTVAAANVSGLSTVATSGSYTDLSNTPTLGSIAVVNLDGSASNVLYGDGTFGPVPNPFNQSLNTNSSPNFSGVTTDIVYANSLSTTSGSFGHDTTNLRISATANVNLVTDNMAANTTWTFDTSGVLHLPSGGDIVNSSGQTVLGSLPRASIINIPDPDVTCDNIRVMMNNGIITIRESNGGSLALLYSGRTVTASGTQSILSTGGTSVNTGEAFTIATLADKGDSMVLDYVYDANTNKVYRINVMVSWSSSPYGGIIIERIA